MSYHRNLPRRAILRAAGSAVGLTAVGSTALAADRPRTAELALGFDNADFYADGKFLVEKGKDAVLALCKHHGYPVFPGFREKLWVSDYGKGEYTELGLAAYVFVNNEEDRYMMLDIFLLPRQMLPEHWHVDGDKNPAKREGWLVRWGLSHIVGIGVPNLGKEVAVPRCYMSGKVTVEHEVVAGPGTFVKLAEAYSHHWQFAGPHGAIVTEVANVHTDSAVRHLDPDIDKFFRTQ